MSTHSYEIEEATQPPGPEPDEQLDDLMYDVQSAHARGLYTPIGGQWSDES